MSSTPSPTPSGSAPRRSTGLLSIAAVIGFVLLWWLFSGNGPRGPEGNDPVLLAPDVAAEGDGSTAPSAVPIALANGLRLEGYAAQAEDRLELVLTVPAGTCPDLEPPRVSESDVAVTVTVTHSTEPTCEPLTRARAATVPVRLDSPLGDRSVLDGAPVQQVRLAPLDGS
jgi:hypothetical protein